ncbi:Nuclear control of ATPase protein 2 [Elasticomyces elasticus]|nr:Nuclear control of ATPase protein 2 [Elasticomyces elasticus]
MHGEGLATPSEGDTVHKWKTSMAHNVALIEAVLAKASDSDLNIDKFEASINEFTDDDPLYDLYEAEGSITVRPTTVAERISRVLSQSLPAYSAASLRAVEEHGRPSRLVRYWLPATLLVLSSSTILRILVNRQAEIVTWLEDLGTTVIDFWRNWVVEPTRKVIKTIRHDEGSEVSIMSKRSLEGDRASLERMVVDFAIDNPPTGAPLTAPEIADIRAKVREGDLTPVLRAYEKDLARPLAGTVRGNLIRTLLIQLQKTKVDVEVAMGGIDALLKSQELVFGFVGLTPGVLVCVAAVRWLRATFAAAPSSSRRRQEGTRHLMLRQLRNVDRILTNARPTGFGELPYRDHGLLLCEVHVLRQEAERVMPKTGEFCEEIDELLDVRAGVQRQQRVVERMRWAYRVWL